MLKRRKITEPEKRAVYRKCNGHCSYCGIEIEINEMVIDHFYPISKESPIEVESILNYMPSCKICNSLKSCSDFETFKNRVIKYLSVFKKIDYFDFYFEKNGNYLTIFPTDIN